MGGMAEDLSSLCRKTRNITEPLGNNKGSSGVLRDYGILHLEGVLRHTLSPSKAKCQRGLWVRQDSNSTQSTLVEIKGASPRMLKEPLCVRDGSALCTRSVQGTPIRLLRKGP